MARIDRVWTGSYSPLSVEYSGNTYTPALAEADWYAPLHIVLARLQTALRTASSDATWTIALSSGVVTISHAGAFDLTLQPGFAGYLGFSGSTHEAISTVSSDETIIALVTPLAVTSSLPVMLWQREIVGHRPIVWSGPYFAHDIEIVDNSEPDWLPECEVHCVWWGDDAIWTTSNRDGWLCLRPIADQWNPELMDPSISGPNKIKYRAMAVEAAYAE